LKLHKTPARNLLYGPKHLNISSEHKMKDLTAIEMMTKEDVRMNDPVAGWLTWEEII
jgi:hypothetical protein